MTLALFNLAVPIRSLKVGDRFLYDTEIEGVVTAHEHYGARADLYTQGYKFATAMGLTEDVEPL